MKTSLIALVAFAVVALADPVQKERTVVGKDATLRDGSGRVTGVANTSGKNTTFRDGSGRFTGTAAVSHNGSQTFRDGSGRITGTASPSGKNTTYRDASGTAQAVVEEALKLQELWPTLDLERKRQIVQSLVQSITVDVDAQRITLVFTCLPSSEETTNTQQRL